jgi:hypothetical protein
LIIEPLSKLHHRKSFDSGDPEVNRFLHEQALQDHGKDMSRTMVLVDDVKPSTIIGYHTLAIQYVRQETDEVSRRAGVRAMMLDARSVSRSGTKSTISSAFPGNCACSKASQRSAGLPSFGRTVLVWLGGSPQCFKIERFHLQERFGHAGQFRG